jgi:hypothetical protein
MLLDPTSSNLLHSNPIIKIHGQIYQFPQYPYQGLILLDKILAREHVTSRFFTPNSAVAPLGISGNSRNRRDSGYY